MSDNFFEESTAAVATPPLKRTELFSKRILPNTKITKPCLLIL